VGRPGSDLVISLFRSGSVLKGTTEFAGGASMREHAGESAAVFCPACRKPMTSSEPIPVTNRMFEIIYRCDACDATTLRAVKILAANLGNRRGAREQ